MSRLAKLFDAVCSGRREAQDALTRELPMWGHIARPVFDALARAGLVVVRSDWLVELDEARIAYREKARLWDEHVAACRVLEETRPRLPGLSEAERQLGENRDELLGVRDRT